RDIAGEGCASRELHYPPPLLHPACISPSPNADLPSSKTTINIVSPTEDEVFEGTADAPAHVLMEIRVLGARIVPLTSTRLRPDEAHVHLFLDGSLVSMSAGTTPSRHAGPCTPVDRAELLASAL